MGLMKKADEILDHGSIDEKYTAAVFILHMSNRQDFAYFTRYGLAVSKLEKLYLKY